jgi:hypothetical protein
MRGKARDILILKRITDFSTTVSAGLKPQALVSFKKYKPPPLPYFKVNICPLPLPHFASIFSPYL